MAVPVTVAVSGGVAVPVAAPVAGCTKDAAFSLVRRECLYVSGQTGLKPKFAFRISVFNHNDFLSNVWG